MIEIITSLTAQRLHLQELLAEEVIHIRGACVPKGVWYNIERSKTKDPPELASPMQNPSEIFIRAIVKP